MKRNWAFSEEMHMHIHTQKGMIAHEVGMLGITPHQNGSWTFSAYRLSPGGNKSLMEDESVIPLLEEDRLSLIHI